MPQGFYELLGVPASAAQAEVETAYQKQLAALVRRLRHARQQGADVRILEAQERALREARTVLADPARRRRYDAYRSANERGLPQDAEQLWARAAEALVDPDTVAALRVVRTLTDLPVGDPFPGVSDPTSHYRVPSQGPSSQGPSSQGPSSQGPSSQGPSSQGPSSQGPSSQPYGAGSAAPSSPHGAASPPAINLPPPGPAVTATAAPPAEPAFADAGDTAVVDLLGRLPRFDPLDELLADLSGTDAGVRAPAPPEPLDPIDRHARDFGYDGRFLRAVREARGIGLDDLSRATRISNRYLEAIEANGFDQLPAATFVRGYLKEIVKVLELSDRDVVGGYMALFQRQRGS